MGTLELLPCSSCLQSDLQFFEDDDKRMGYDDDKQMGYHIFISAVLHVDGRKSSTPQNKIVYAMR
jgi:hypothetical protein